VKSRALFSPEPARGWIPWGALAPPLAFAFVVLPMLGVLLAFERLQLVDTEGDPIGNTGLAAFLLIPFGVVGLLVLGWVKFVERRPFATIGFSRVDSPSDARRSSSSSWQAGSPADMKPSRTRRGCVRPWRC
jgi:hypothetical protein